MEYLSQEKVLKIIELADFAHPPGVVDSQWPDMANILAPNKEQDDLFDFIDALSDGEKWELVALAWIGRGEGKYPRDWHALLRRAEDAISAPGLYLGEKRPLADYLREGLKQLRRSAQSPP